MKQRNHSNSIILNKEEFCLFLKNATLIVVTVVSLALVCLLKIVSDSRNANAFIRDVYINDIGVHGMTYDEALKTVQASTTNYLESLIISLDANGSTYDITGSEFITADTDGTVRRAFEAEHMEDEQNSPECDRFYTTYHIDTQKLRELLNEIATQTNMEALEPVAEFNTENHSFLYKNGESGKVLDVDAALKAVTEHIKNANFEKIGLVYNTTYPIHTVDDLKSNTSLIAEFTSETTNNYNRNVNISLMCGYINGCVIKPGEILSINDLVGQRTKEKGFLEAPAIMDGKRTVDDIGGGICQLSGTLYNVALLSNMKIIERHPHSWPSDYLDIGLDSTLDWDTQKDLKLQNITEYNIYLAAWLEKSDFSQDNVLHVAAYGQPYPSGITVEIESEIIETIAPQPANVIYTSSMNRGKSATVIKARTGYRTRVWRYFYYNGKLIDSEIVGISYYAPIRGEIKVGTYESRPSSSNNDALPEEPIIDPPDNNPPITDYGN